ncbi:2-succinyl-6-hydroxy-2,4-cyclohexadiene-1-carboxylate synthase [Alkalimarinus coralli]|uniref:2-succinyl-6-hydroxy-2, 4-cyclohexadiene-1-carboxylate synthase n=1 Tax=Alkalimarinus coralli TaxID=2935863 RepID=UPI00202B463B|nr:2-succinyl-6-hydroxy-2,4-cyclohexadiene-1-carboxylate synthase [Alkalimarinus coralli]
MLTTDSAACDNLKDIVSNGITCRGDRNNPAVVFIHGFLGNREEWQQVVETLRETFYCITVDLPGHGDQQEQHNDWPSEDSLERMYTRIIQASSKPFHLVGYSLGGRLAMRLAYEKPNQVISLCLESANPGLESVESRKERGLSDHAWAKRFAYEPLETVLTDWYQQPIFGTKGTDQQRSLVKAHLNQSAIPLAKALTEFGLGLQPPYWRFLSQWRKPLCYISGEYDAKFTEIGRQLNNINPSLRHAIISNAAHNCHIDQPQHFIDVISDHLTTNGLRRYS